MQLSHYSSEPLPSEFRPVNQGQDYVAQPFGKPRGLWVSVDGAMDWVEWCLAEGFELDRLKYRQIVVLKEDSNILYITKDMELRWFHAEFGSPYRDYTISAVDWKRVAARYDGIVIAPYLWSMRFDLSVTWYYGWDCASGCIWNPDAIEEVIPDDSWLVPQYSPDEGEEE